MHRTDGPEATDLESAPLLDASVNPDGVFRRALDAELEKIGSFYQIKELELFGQVEELAKDEREYSFQTDGVNMDPVSETVIKARAMSAGSRQRTGSRFQTVGLDQNRRSSGVSDSLGEDGDADSDDEQSISGSRRRPRSNSDVNHMEDGDHGEMSNSHVLEPSRMGGAAGRSGSRPNLQDERFADARFLDLYNSGVSLKKRCIEIYVSLCGLKSYIQLNKTGFSKALKKFDKILDRNLRREYMSTTVSQAYPFTDSTMKRVEANIAMVEKMYADVVTKGDIQDARRELRLHLREHVVWERNTVWREMIGIERKAQAANVGIRRTLLGGDLDPSTARRQGDEQEVPTTQIDTPLGRYQVPEWLCSLSFGTLIGILIVFAVLLAVPIMETPEQQNCLAMLVFVSLLWATEVCKEASN